MKTTDEIREIALEKAKQFTQVRNGQFRKHVSDEFLQAYLSQQFADLYREWKAKKLSPDPVRLAYDSACWLFETVLEHGCRIGCNGHHVAQGYAEYFKDVSFEGLTKQKL